MSPSIEQRQEENRQQQQQQQQQSSSATTTTTTKKNNEEGRQRPTFKLSGFGRSNSYSSRCSNNNNRKLLNNNNNKKVTLVPKETSSIRSTNNNKRIKTTTKTTITKRRNKYYDTSLLPPIPKSFTTNLSLELSALEREIFSDDDEEKEIIKTKNKSNTNIIHKNNKKEEMRKKLVQCRTSLSKTMMKNNNDIDHDTDTDDENSLSIIIKDDNKMMSTSNTINNDVKKASKTTTDLSSSRNNISNTKQANIASQKIVATDPVTKNLKTVDDTTTTTTTIKNNTNNESSITTAAQSPKPTTSLVTKMSSNSSICCSKNKDDDSTTEKEKKVIGSSSFTEASTSITSTVTTTTTTTTKELLLEMVTQCFYNTDPTKTTLKDILMMVAEKLHRTSNDFNKEEKKLIRNHLSSIMKEQQQQQPNIDNLLHVVDEIFNKTAAMTNGLQSCTIKQFILLTQEHFHNISFTKTTKEQIKNRIKILLQNQHNNNNNTIIKKENHQTSSIKGSNKKNNTSSQDVVKNINNNFKHSTSNDCTITSSYFQKNSENSTNILSSSSETTTITVQSSNHNNTTTTILKKNINDVDDNNANDNNKSHKNNKHQEDLISYNFSPIQNTIVKDTELIKASSTNLIIKKPHKNLQHYKENVPTQSDSEKTCSEIKGSTPTSDDQNEITIGNTKNNNNNISSKPVQNSNNCSEIDAKQQTNQVKTLSTIDLSDDDDIRHNDKSNIHTTTNATTTGNDNSNLCETTQNSKKSAQMNLNKSTDKFTVDLSDDDDDVRDKDAFENSNIHSKSAAPNAMIKDPETNHGIKITSKPKETDTAMLPLKNESKDTENKCLEGEKQVKRRGAKNPKKETSTATATTAAKRKAAPRTTAANNRYKRTKESCCHLCAKCPCQDRSTRESTGSAGGGTVNFAQSDLDIEKALIKRLHTLEKTADRYDEQTEAVRRQLKKHRRDMWKRREDLSKACDDFIAGRLTKTFSKKSNRFLKDSHELDEQFSKEKPKKKLSKSAIERAKKGIFDPKPVIQPTLTQMLGIGKDDDDEDDDDNIPANDDDNSRKLDAKGDSVDEVDSREEIDNASEDGMDISDEDGFKSPSPVKRRRVEWKGNLACSGVNLDESQSIWNAIRSGNYDSSWDTIFQDKSEDNSDKLGVEHLLSLLGGDLTQHSPKPSTSDSVNNEVFSQSSLSSNEQALAEKMIENIQSNPTKLDAMKQICPQWKENIYFTVRQKEDYAKSEALENLRETQRRLKRAKQAIIENLERQETALNVFEEMILQSDSTESSSKEETEASNHEKAADLPVDKNNCVRPRPSVDSKVLSILASLSPTSPGKFFYTTCHNEDDLQGATSKTNSPVRMEQQKQAMMLMASP